MAKVRLDRVLVERGLFESRARAAAAVLAGEVRLGESRTPARKPGQPVDADIVLAVDPGRPFVSRGGMKLENALESFSVVVTGARCLDIGCSTGGFTDCLLKSGASHVVAVDVAYGALHWSLRNDPRVTVLERVNARYLREEDLPYRPDMITVDVSFISLEKVLPAVLGTGKEGFRCLALVKPQFEAGREHVENGGVVRDPAARRGALVQVGEAVKSMGYSVAGYAYCGVAGPAGNRESFVLIEDGAGGLHDLGAAAMVAEPATGDTSPDESGMSELNKGDTVMGGIDAGGAAGSGADTDDTVVGDTTTDDTEESGNAQPETN